MAEQAKRKSYPIQVTPKAPASWPKLHQPDEKYHKYQIGLRFTVDEGNAFLDQFKQIDAENHAEALTKIKGKRDPKTGKELEVNHAGLPFRLEFDKTTGEPTGFMTINFSAKSTWKDKQGKENPTKLILQDAAKKPIPASVAIGGGSICKVAFQPSPYYVDGTRTAGVTFRLIGVQVLDCKANSHDPFATEEGFSAPSDDTAVNTEGAGVQAATTGDF